MGVGAGRGGSRRRRLCCVAVLASAGLVCGCAAPPVVAVVAPPASSRPAPVARLPEALSLAGGLDALDRVVGRAAPVDVRNPFRFGVVSEREASSRRGGNGGRVPAAGARRAPAGAVGHARSSAPEPPGPALSSLRVIGVVEPGRGAGAVAVLADGRDISHGRVGAVVGGRYRIVSIDGVSVVLSQLPGGARQVLRRPGP